MKPINRRRFIKFIAAAPVGLPLIPAVAHATECKVPHPFKPPHSQYRGQCPVCGMVRQMWARTWITFDPIKDVSQACSFHCLADWIVKSGREPLNIMLTIYHQPGKTVSANKAVIVMGSPAAGTMSPVSKIVFDQRSKAESFALSCGGTVVDYPQALIAARESVARENGMIHTRRLKKGKIIEPAENDRCTVCDMYPIRYPYGKCQIRTKDGKPIHFCSTQCLFAFLDKQTLYLPKPVEPLLIWVVDRNSGLWISGRAAFYVIGSKKVFGPMGYEAIPFNSIKEAEEFTTENGGIVAIFRDVTIDKIVPQWKHVITKVKQEKSE